VGLQQRKQPQHPGTRVRHAPSLLFIAVRNWPHSTLALVS
jgi:hypothetical protein